MNEKLAISCDYNSYMNAQKSYHVKITPNHNVRKSTWSTGCAKYQLMGILAFGMIDLHTGICTRTHECAHTHIQLPPATEEWREREVTWCWGFPLHLCLCIFLALSKKNFTYSASCFFLNYSYKIIFHSYKTPLVVIGY